MTEDATLSLEVVGPRAGGERVYGVIGHIGAGVWLRTEEGLARLHLERPGHKARSHGHTHAPPAVLPDNPMLQWEWRGEIRTQFAPQEYDC